MKKVGPKYMLIVLTMLLAVLSGGHAYASSGAKAIFYDEGGVSVPATAAKASPVKKKSSNQNQPSAPAREEYLGISYWIDLLDRDEKSVRTTTSRVFRSGDRIKLNLQSNRDGYLYIIGLGSTGNSRVLFPNTEGVANGIKARVTYAVPFDTNLKFDDNPGEETLLVLLAERPLREISPGQKILPEQETRQLVASANMPGAKDLVLEEEVAEGGIAPAKFAVVPVSALGQSGSLPLVIKLKHQ